MTSRFTLGIEEELQMVDPRTGQLCPRILTIMEKGAAIFGERIKPEMLQAAVEVVSPVCLDIAAARRELYRMHTTLARLLEEEGLMFIAAGTHPSASWLEQVTTPNERYMQLEEELQDVVRSILIFALHVHVHVESNEMAIVLILAAAVAAGSGPVTQVAVACIDVPPAAPLNERSPCGACRQWLADLAPHAVIYIDGDARDFSVADLLPYAFGLP